MLLIILLHLISCSSAMPVTIFPPLGGQAERNSQLINTTPTINQSVIAESKLPSKAMKTAHICPRECNCFARAVVDCSHSGLVLFPKDNTSSRETNSTEQRGNVISASTQQLYLGFNNITTLQNDWLTGGHNLQNLYLQNNSISNIQRYALRGVANLKYLDLSHNLVSTLVNVVTSLTRHNISSRCVSVFSPLRDSLLSLQLSHNQIGEVPDESFTGFRRLQFLSLMNNRISWIGERAFADLSQLNVLILRSNPLGLVTISRLERILAWFSTELVVPTSETNSEKCSVIHLNNSQTAKDSLHVLDLGETKLTSVPNTLPVSVQILMLDGNNISEITQSKFAKNPFLQVLFLANNNISSIPGGTFQYNHQLYLLDISRNKLRRVSEKAFCGLVNLQILRMYKNPTLRHIPSKVFATLSQLSALYLHDCGLRELPMGPWIHRISGLWLYGNPLNCSCSTLLPILSELHYPGNKMLALDPYRHPFKGLYNRNFIWDDENTWPYQRPAQSRCLSPPNLRGRSIKDIYLHEVSCPVQDWNLATRNKRLASYKHVPFDVDPSQATTPTNEISLLQDVSPGITDRNISDNTMWIFKIPENIEEFGNEHDYEGYYHSQDNADMFSGDIPAAVEFENDVEYLLEEEQANQYRAKTQETDLFEEWDSYYGHLIRDDVLAGLFKLKNGDYDFV